MHPSGWPVSRCGAQAWQPHFLSRSLSALLSGSCSLSVVSVLTISCQLLLAFQSAPIATATGKDAGLRDSPPWLAGVLTQSTRAAP